MGTALNYQVLEEAVSHVRRSSSKMMHASLAGGAWKAKIDQDFESRSDEKKGRRAV